MDFDKDQIDLLHEALLSAFPNYSDLLSMVKRKLGEPLGQIAAPGNHSAVTLDVIVWVESKGKLRELTQAALEANPTNPKLLTFTGALGMVVPAPRPKGQASARDRARAVKAEALRERIETLAEDFEAVNKEVSRGIDPLALAKLKRRAKDIQAELDAAADELDSLE